jgi:hypothetical protein
LFVATLWASLFVGLWASFDHNHNPDTCR